MSIKDPIIDFDQVDLDHIVADLDEIRRHNPQRFEMEQLSAVVVEDLENQICVGYKDIGDDEFWVRGHMPGMPLMPGVVMLEAMAQLCGFYASRTKLLGENSICGFGGVEECKFRGPVRPGDRLVLAAKAIRVRKGRMLICRFQGVVDGKLVVEGILRGIALPKDSL